MTVSPQRRPPHQFSSCTGAIQFLN